MAERSVQLPAKFRVDATSELRDACVAALQELAADDVLELDASQVTDVDATGLQLIYAVRRACSASGVLLKLSRPGESVIEGGRVLGLGLEKA
jgi:anti-anti-sigma regulatory factor